MIRVMIVAHHPQVREGLRTVLELADGIQVVQAASGLGEALAQAERKCPDAVIIDLEMPGGEGYETLRQMKRRFPTASPLGLTARTDADTRERALRAGASLVLVKGLALPEMAAAIRTAAGEKETQDGRDDES